MSKKVRCVAPSVFFILSAPVGISSSWTLSMPSHWMQGIRSNACSRKLVFAAWKYLLVRLFPMQRYCTLMISLRVFFDWERNNKFPHDPQRGNPLPDLVLEYDALAICGLHVTTTSSIYLLSISVEWTSSLV